ncbi:PSP1 domain-containing protein [Gemmatimonas phototrophica]|uniref:PSP1 domain-containing protein n=1 Tax=Gemmatimonas phototrophica TaxID=1379270 RepID=UPI001313E9FF|nr:regulatory iron-sulfur-containing complex subunit RicT [Gemmatimonas phototrophica]
MPPPLRAAVIVEADRGEDFGRVHSTGELAAVRCNGCAHGCGTAPPPRKALRLATKADEQLERVLTEENELARRASMERVKANGLVMKLTDAEWQWDRRKLTIFFTAEKRVDFRGLVRDLAAQFKTRIELKQIGVRDEAKRLSGIGRCGREYCSASWLPDLRPVNLGVAKDQKLSLNPQQISGACGRLMCCLRYEHEFYVQSRRKFPKEGKILVTSRGEEKVVSCDIFHERVTLRSVEGDTRIIPLAELKSEVGGEASAVLVESASDTAHEGAAASDPMMDTGTISMLDTAEYEAVSMMDLLPPRPMSAPAPVLPELPATVAAVEPAPAVSEPEADAGPDDDEAPSADGSPRRKRRRGRRGGRRLRAAEERRKTDGDAADGSVDEGEDGDGDSDGDSD